jgi:hypothetical protein
MRSVKLPFAEHAIIDPRKLRDYALSPEHPVGRFKATFFSSLGFTARNWKELDQELRNLVFWNEAELGERTAFGQKYVVGGRINGPAGRAVEIVAVWIVLEGEQIPRLVTLYPGAQP